LPFFTTSGSAGAAAAATRIRLGHYLFLDYRHVGHGRIFVGDET